MKNAKDLGSTLKTKQYGPFKHHFCGSDLHTVQSRCKLPMPGCSRSDRCFTSFLTCKDLLKNPLANTRIYPRVFKTAWVSLNHYLKLLIGCSLPCQVTKSASRTIMSDWFEGETTTGRTIHYLLAKRHIPQTYCVPVSTEPVNVAHPYRLSQHLDLLLF